MANIPRWFLGLVLIVLLALGIIMNANNANGQTINGDIDICKLLQGEQETFDKVVSVMQDLLKLSKMKQESGEAKVTDEMIHAIEVAISHYEGLRDKTAEHVQENGCLVGEPG